MPTRALVAFYLGILLWALAPSTAATEPIAPADWLIEVHQQIAEREYEWTWQSRQEEGLNDAWHAPNRVQDLRCFIDGNGIEMLPRQTEVPPWSWRLSAIRYGSGSSAWPLPTGDVSVSGKLAEISRAGIVEWFENRREGIEHGFKLNLPADDWAAALPEEDRIDVATGTPDTAFLDLAVTGDLRAVLAPDGQSLEFLTADGSPGIHYAKLVVIDAQGRRLNSRMELFAGAGTQGIRLLFDTENAVYPLSVDPLATSAAWTGEADQAGAFFGLSVGTAGDVNGDGYSDITVGAYAYDNGESDEGRAFVYHGSPSGPSLTASWTAESNQAGARFGYSVGTAGDVDGDGFSDLVVGAYLFDNGEPNEGRAFVYRGSPAGLEVTAAWTAEVDQQGAQFGHAVGSAGDVNGDGYSDLIVGAYSFDVGFKNDGAAFLYLGSASGPSPTHAWFRGGQQEGASFGYSVGTAGDVNGDGYSDVIVGARFQDGAQPDSGRAYVFHGSAIGLGGPPQWTTDGAQAFSLYGSSVATAGDLNGDGFSDVVVGEPFYDNGQENEGRALAYFGSPGGLSSTPGWTQESNRANARYGTAVSHAGDLNGDGFGDLAVGAPQFNEGRAFVYRGSPSGPASAASYVIESSQPGANFAYALSSAGDTNGDGYGELIVGAYSFNGGSFGEGAAFTYMGSAEGPELTASWAVSSEQTEPEFGFAVAGIGDVNGDGFADVAVGAPRFDVSSADDGAVFAFYGSANGLSTNADWLINVGQNGARFGEAVAAAGDVDGDGYSDLIVGAPRFNQFGFTDGGAAFVYNGSPSGLLVVSTWTTGLAQTSGLFGSSVNGAGDVNGDGYDDVIVGAPFAGTPQFDEGKVFVYHGSPLGLATAESWTTELDQAGANLGNSVAGAGDVDGDGYSDVIVGAPNFDDLFIDEGVALVFLGGPSGLDAASTWHAFGEQQGAGYGRRVAGAGDVDGDGLADVLVGAPAYDRGGVNNGAAWLYSGVATGVDEAPAWTGEGDSDNGLFGDGVAGVGDVNGDGFADFVVGASRQDGSQANLGAVFLYTGSALGPGTESNWAVEGTGPLTSFGSAVAGAGDVNGDGYSDILIGAAGATVSMFRDGFARVYFGAGGKLPSLRPKQSQLVTGDPLPQRGWASGDGFRISATGRSAYGRGGVRLETEVKPYGVPFDGLGTSIQPDWFDTDVDGVELALEQAGLATGPYRWRARLRYNPVGLPFASNSRWFTVPSNSWETSDLRLVDQVDLSVSLDDNPNPVGTNQIVTYTAVVENHGPDSASGVWLDNTLPGGASFFSASFDFPGGTCDPENAGRVVCELGDLGIGVQKTVTIRLVAQSTDGAMTHFVRVFANGARDPQPGNDTATTTTIVGSPEIGDRVWDDLDRDGIQDTGEGGVPGVVVELRNVDNSLVATAVTDLSGLYGFTVTDLEASYYLRFVAPPGRFFSPSDATADDSLDSDVDPLTGETPVFTLTSGDGSKWDAGTSEARIGNRVWDDLDQDGVQDPGEGGLPGIVVELRNGDSTLVGTTVTDAFGQYSFAVTDLEASYFLRFLAPVGRFFSPRDATADDLFDSDVDPTTGETPIFTLTSDDDSRWDAGMFEARIGDRVWNDFNWNGIQDPEESGTGIVGVVVELRNGNGSLVATTATDASGRYSFALTDISASYFLRFQEPAGWFFSPRDASGNDSTDSDVDPVTGDTPVFTLGSGDALKWDAGIFLARVAGVVWEDSDADGIRELGEPLVSNLLVQLRLEGTGTTYSSSTNSQGVFLINNVPSYATYTLRFVAPADRFFTIANAGTAESLDSDPDPVTGVTAPFVLGPLNGGEWGAGLVETAIGDSVWDDLNGDGIQDPGEPGISNVIVALSDPSGNILSTTVSDGIGRYRFPALSGAQYRLRFFLPIGKFFTLQDAGGSDTADSDADPFTGETDLFTLEPGGESMWDAGMTDCPAPDEPVFIYAWRLSTDGNDYTIVDFEDPNQPTQVTGYNVYRSADAGLPPAQWEMVASNVVDGDEATPNNQWIDITDDPSPSGVWFYEIAAFNADCGLEGPR